MNNDSINRQDAIETALTFFVEYFGGAFREDDQLMLKKRMEQLPPAQPEQKNGGWIYYDPNGFKCLRCGRYLEIGCGDVKMNFCPHCGGYNGDEQNE